MAYSLKIGFEEWRQYPIKYHPESRIYYYIKKILTMTTINPLFKNTLPGKTNLGGLGSMGLLSGVSDCYNLATGQSGKPPNLESFDILRFGPYGLYPKENKSIKFLLGTS